MVVLLNPDALQKRLNSRYLIPEEHMKLQPGCGMHRRWVVTILRVQQVRAQLRAASKIQAKVVVMILLCCGSRLLQKAAAIPSSTFWLHMHPLTQNPA